MLITEKQQGLIRYLVHQFCQREYAGIENQDSYIGKLNSYLVDKKPGFIPLYELTSEQASIVINDLTSGVWKVKMFRSTEEFLIVEAKKIIEEQKSQIFNLNVKILDLETEKARMLANLKLVQCELCEGEGGDRNTKKACVKCDGKGYLPI